MSVQGSLPPWPAEFDQYAAEQAVASLPCPDETARIVVLEREVRSLRDAKETLARVKEIASCHGPLASQRLHDIVKLLGD